MRGTYSVTKSSQVFRVANGGVRGYTSAYNSSDGKLAWRGHSVGSDADMVVDPSTTTTWTDGKVTPVGKDSSLKNWKADQWKIGGGTT